MLYGGFAYPTIHLHVPTNAGMVTEVKSTVCNKHTSMLTMIIRNNELNAFAVYTM